MSFVKGDPRINRKGRPRKGQTLTDILSSKLDTATQGGKLRRETVLEKLISMAENGDIAAIRYVVDRIDGKPREIVEIQNNDIDLRLKEIARNGQ